MYAPALGFLLLATNLLAANTNSVSTPKFLGAQSCSSSSCHGGAGEKSNQYTIWSTRDFHHQRPYATLTTARSERFAEVLKIGDATQSPRCTVCHAPFATVPKERLAKGVEISEGVSCESCHGPAENWIRSHTRPDYTHADRVTAGMRDLKNLYVRANTCVACHQNIDPEIRAAGHPELIFEMDGQCVTMPRHWSKTNDLPGPQSWIVGQAVALREASWELMNQQSPNENLINRWRGLVFVITRAGAVAPDFPAPPDVTFRPNIENFQPTQKWGDEFALRAAALSWSDALSKRTLIASSDTASDFDSIPQAASARRAERLVLELDRLVAAMPDVSINSAVNQSLNKLFADAESLPDFDPKQFAKDLKAFQTSVSTLESK